MSQTTYIPKDPGITASRVYPRDLHEEIDRNFRHLVIDFRPPKKGERFLTSTRGEPQICESDTYFTEKEPRLIIVPVIKTIQLVW